MTRADGDSPYGCIDEVRLGNHLACPVILPQNDLLIIGADGHKECGRLYGQVLKGRESAAYTPLYGSFPAAAGFDLAVAAVSLHDRTLYASPDPGGAPDAGVVLPQTLDNNQLAYLKFGSGGDYGLIRLST